MVGKGTAPGAKKLNRCYVSRKKDAAIATFARETFFYGSMRIFAYLTGPLDNADFICYAGHSAISELNNMHYFQGALHYLRPAPLSIFPLSLFSIP
jgi:hypothetical protein